MENWQIRQEAMLPGSTDILSKKHVTVFGIGGVGGYVCEALARAGVGKFRLVDGDTVAYSNLNRQIIATVDTVGMNKTDVMKNRILSVNPNAKVETVNKFVTTSDVPELLKDTDFVADAIDTVAVKIELARYCDENNINIIASMGTGNKLHPELFEIADIYETSICPLCRSMRSRLKALGVKKLPVVYSKETPKSVVTDTKNGRHAPASVSFVPPASGLVMAGYIVRTILGEE